MTRLHRLCTTIGSLPKPNDSTERTYAQRSMCFASIYQLLNAASIKRINTY